MPTGSNQTVIRAAGGLVWSPAGGPGRRIAIVHRARRADWALPKGKPEKNESPADTALREAMEETGFNLEPGPYAGSYEYEVKGRPKVVEMWHMRQLPGEYANRAPLKEVDQVVWLPPEEAIERLTHVVEREFLAAHANPPDWDQSRI